MKVVKESRILVSELSDSQKTVGLVPTMGALHQGHLELVKKSKEDNDLTVVSIYVNQTQFNKKEDFDNYPNTLDVDLKLLAELDVDFVFIPSFEDMYPDGYRFKMTENEFSKDLCGIDRPGHFDGVLSIILKLLNITKATNAYFGKKDYQQYKLIKDMTKAYFLKTKIIGVDTVREKDGLAMSSRNLRLTKQDRGKAPLIYKELKENTSLAGIRDTLTKEGFDIHYLKEFDGRRYIAASLGNIRLIDNVER